MVFTLPPLLADISREAGINIRVLDSVDKPELLTERRFNEFRAFSEDVHTISVYLYGDAGQPIVERLSSKLDFSSRLIHILTGIATDCRYTDFSLRAVCLVFQDEYKRFVVIPEIESQLTEARVTAQKEG